MGWRLTDERMIRLETDGSCHIAAPGADQDIALPPTFLDLLAAIGSGQAPEAWAEKRGMPHPMLKVCLEKLVLAGLVIHDESDAGPGGVALGEARPGHDHPIYVVSAMRSGSTLLRYLLDTHSALACPPETKFIGGLKAFVDFPDAIMALATLGYDLEAVHTNLRQLVQSFMEGYTRGRNKRRWVDKTPGYHRHLDFINALFDGQVQFLCLYRHPLDSVASLEDMWLGHGGLERQPDLAASVERYGRGRLAYADYWAHVNEVIHTFASAHPTQCLELRYESMVTDPEGVMSRILRHVGEEPEPGIAERAFAEQHSEGFQDHKIVRTDRVLSDRVDQWRRWPEAEARALAPIVAPLAQKLGYDLPDAGPLAPPI